MNIFEKKSIKSEFRALGTDVFLEIVLDGQREKEKARKDLREAKSIFLAKEKIFSRFDSKSELSKLNENLTVWQRVSPDILYLSRRVLHYNKLSDGLYDSRVIGILEKIGYEKDFKKTDFSMCDIPEKFVEIDGYLQNDLMIKGNTIFFGRRMDFSGIAKGYIVDQSSKFLKKKGWKNFLVDAGGDMRIIGKNSEGEDWKIAVEGVPEKKLMLRLSNCGIATSGISRKKWIIGGKKFHHLVNPRNPNNFSYELRTVSVIAKDTENADGRAKTLVLMGKKAGLKFARKNKIAAVFFDYKGNIFVSSEAKKYIYAVK